MNLNILRQGAIILLPTPQTLPLIFAGLPSWTLIQQKSTTRINETSMLEISITVDISSFLWHCFYDSSAFVLMASDKLLSSPSAVQSLIMMMTITVRKPRNQNLILWSSTSSHWPEGLLRSSLFMKCLI